MADQGCVRVALERTPTDFALEHAEYLAKGAERYLSAESAEAAARQALDDNDDESRDVELADALDAAMQCSDDYATGLRRRIYEFRKRRDRAAAPERTQTGEIACGARAEGAYAEPGLLDAVFGLLLESERAVLRAGWTATSSLPHEMRSIAQRVERGDFENLRARLKTAVRLSVAAKAEAEESAVRSRGGSEPNIDPYLLIFWRAGWDACQLSGGAHRPAPAPPQWVSVEDRMPEPRQSVALVDARRFENVGGDDWERNIHACGYLDNWARWHWSVRGERAISLDSFTHWLPLPAAPATMPATEPKP